MEYNKDEALDLLRLMVTTKTVNPPGNEAELARKLQPILEKEGLEVTLDEFLPNRANMIVRLKGKNAKPELMLTGHLDTVPVGTVKWEHDPFAFDIVDGIVYGRGVDDMKGGDAAALYAMIMLKRNGIVPENDVVFVGTVGEETMDLGSGHFTANGGMKDCGALVGEVLTPGFVEHSIKIDSEKTDEEVEFVAKCYTDSTKTCVMSDDSVLTIYYWDTEEGGTAPAIDASCFYRAESGKGKEESRPLLSLAYPESDCFHHEVKNIMTIHTTYDERIYLLYIWSKVGSNEFTHDLVALKVEGEELKAVNIFPGNRAGIPIDADHITPDYLNYAE